MRTTFPLALVLCLGIALLMFQGSGFNALVSGSQEPGQLGDAVEKQADSSAVQQDQDLDVSRTSSGDGTIAGLILSGGSGIVSVVGLVAKAPITLQRLGFPGWFAVPIGFGFYILGAIGLFQLVSGRTLE